ncbi:hypothetical protein K1T71_008033 [Dendrolimus kikuchii]|uniref:Uncharacterized protein n=1 Tax=Dendrolimus kikuchii TaxID=765133 RepID=A0ACC1CYT8_9NEOP|nr:hypothetical protein K1T71_008033 [Dendrolimus kikuchii]
MSKRQVCKNKPKLHSIVVHILSLKTQKLAQTPGGQCEHELATNNTITTSAIGARRWACRRTDRWEDDPPSEAWEATEASAPILVHCFWAIFVQLMRDLDDDKTLITNEEIRSQKIMQQWMIWMCAIAPLAAYIQTRPRPEAPQLMIWITTSPWQRREMGPYGYYLNRPLASLQSSTNLTIRQQALTMRRAFSDSKVMIKEPMKKKRYSKSV